MFLNKRRVRSKPKVSVLIATYNHEPYISHAIESALMQKVDFDYEIVIGEDSSKDRTRDIVMDYQRRYPDNIRTLLRAKNLGSPKNFVQTYKACRGEYIAMLEGDDYWISPNKLQMQADFLDRHPGLPMCFTNGSIVDENNNIINVSRLNDDRKRNLSQADIILGLIPPTNTVMMRNLIREFPDEYLNIVNADILLCAMITEHGDAGYIDEVTACYRIHDKGVWSSKPKEYQIINYLRTYLVLLRLFRHKYEHILLRAVSNGYASLLEFYKNKDSLL